MVYSGTLNLFRRNGLHPVRRMLGPFPLRRWSEPSSRPAVHGVRVQPNSISQPMSVT